MRILLAELVILLFFSLEAYPLLGSSELRSYEWEDFVVVGDAFRVEDFHYLLGALKEDYRFEALHNTVQAWMGIWEWDVSGRFIQAIHDYGIPAGVVYGYHVSDKVFKPYSASEGFLYYYRMRVPEKWRYPNGSVAPDPYSVGASRQFTGAYTARVFGSPRDIKEYGELSLYFIMQPQNPYWLDFFVDWGKEAIDRGADSFFLDSPDGIFTFYWNGGWGCSDTWEGYTFIQHLKDSLGEDKLIELGITSLDDFCLPKYLKNKYEIQAISSDYTYVRERFKVSWPPESVAFKNVEEVLSDPIFQEALIFWYRSAIDLVKNASRQLKEYAAQNNREIILTSNEYLAWIPHITLTPYMDITYVESGQFTLPPYQTNPIFCKLALAAGNFSKHVWIGEWVGWFSNPFEPDKPPRDMSSLIRLKVAEAYASGCIMLIPFGTGHVDEGGPPRRLVLGPERDKVSAYYRFISENREYFKNTRNHAEVAILTSISTAVWGHIPAIGVWEDNIYEAEILGWSRALEALHIPYEVLTLGMERIFNTDASDRLMDYNLIIAPHLTHISDKDLLKILKYLESGGRIITTKDFAKYDEMHNRRSSDMINKILEHRNVIIADDSLGERYENSLRDKKPDNVVLNRIKDIVTLSMGDRLLETNAKPTTFINPLLQPTTGRIIVHVVNYDYGYNPSEDYTIPQPDFWISLQLPEVYTPSRIYLTSPDRDVNRALLQYEIIGNRINVTVPDVKLWNIIVIEPKTRTETQTITETKTIISRYTVYKISTVTSYETRIETITEKITTTTTSVLTLREEKPPSYGDYIPSTIMIISAVPALIIGFIIGYSLRRRGPTK